MISDEAFQPLLRLPSRIFMAEDKNQWLNMYSFSWCVQIMYIWSMNSGVCIYKLLREMYLDRLCTAAHSSDHSCLYDYVCESVCSAAAQTDGVTGEWMNPKFEHMKSELILQLYWAGSLYFIILQTSVQWHHWTHTTCFHSFEMYAFFYPLPQDGKAHWMLNAVFPFSIFIHEFATTGSGYLTDPVKRAQSGLRHA